MAIGGIITWLVVPWVKVFKYLALEPELHRKRGRATAFVVACAAVIVLLFGLIPFKMYIEAQGVLKPENQQVLHAKVGGFATDVRAKDGQWVKKDDVLLVLSDPELEGKIKEAEAEMTGLVHRRRWALGTGDPSSHQLNELRIKTYEELLADLKRRKSELTVKAPFDGQVIGPDLRNMRQAYIEQGKQLLTVATTDKLLCRAVLTQRDVALASKLRDRATTELHLPTPARIRLVGDIKTPHDGGRTTLIGSAVSSVPSASLTHAGGGEVANDPQDQTGQKAQVNEFELRVAVDNPNDLYVAGQRAYVRLLVDRRPLVWQWYDRFLQLIETKNVNSKWI
jgi:multidrug efflux pump subunit AcrA (membrane-fusion protein)